MLHRNQESIKEQIERQRAFLNLLFDNTILYLSKGIFDFLAVWDLDEYLIPHAPLSSIQQLIQNIPRKQTSPFCSFVFSSAVVLNSQRVISGTPWVGVVYNTNELRGQGLDYNKSIHITNRVFHIGLHWPGACRVHPRYTSCGSRRQEMGFCLASPVPRKECSTATEVLDFNGLVCEKDNLAVPALLAEIYHFQIHRPRLALRDYSPRIGNEYSDRYFKDNLGGWASKATGLLAWFCRLGVRLWAPSCGN